MRRNRNESYDERQIQARGVAFQYGFFSFVIVVLGFAIARSFLNIDATPMGEAFLLISIPYLITMSILIKNDAYDPINSKPGVIIFTFMGLIAIVFILINICNNEQFITNNVITNEGGLAAFYMSWIVIAIVYWIENIKTRREEELDSMISK